MTNTSHDRKVSWLPTAILAVSLTMNVILGLRVLNGPTQAGSLTAASPNIGPEVGDSWPTLTGQDESGAAVYVDFTRSPKPVVVYAISASCSWCAVNEANFAALVKNGSNAYRFVVVALAPDGLREYLARVGSQWAGGDVQVITDPTPGLMQKLKVYGTPQTVVVDKAGKVVAVWPGAYTALKQGEVESFFAVRLPGVQARALDAQTEAVTAGAKRGAGGSVSVARSGCRDVKGQEFGVGWVMVNEKGERVECSRTGRWIAATR